MNTGLNITFLLEHSLPKHYRKRLRAVEQSYANRVAVITSPAYYEYVQLARQHDWIYLTSTRHSYGSILSTLVSSSVPLICHDAPPVRDHITHNFSGKLINCQLMYSPMPVAEVELEDVNHSLDRLLIGPDTLLQAIQSNGAVSFRNKQKAFEQFILKEFMA